MRLRVIVRELVRPVGDAAVGPVRTDGVGPDVSHDGLDAADPGTRLVMVGPGDGGAVAGEPAAVTVDPLTVDPLTGEPVTGDPVTIDPLVMVATVDALPVDALAVDALPVDAFAVGAGAIPHVLQ